MVLFPYLRFCLCVLTCQAFELSFIGLEHDPSLHPLQQESSSSAAVGEYVLSSILRVGISKQPGSRFPVLVKHALSSSVLESRLRQRRRLLVASPSTERERVRILADMNRVIYPATNFTKHMDKLGDVYEAGVNIAGGVGETALERANSETAANEAWHVRFSSALNDVANSRSWSTDFEPGEGEQEGLGVAVALFESDTEAIIVFRGSHSKADFNNMFLWFEGWFMHRLKAQMMQHWQDATGEALSEEMNRRAGVSDLSEVGSGTNCVFVFLSRQGR